MQVDQLDRQYGLLSVCATALTIGEPSFPGLHQAEMDAKILACLFQITRGLRLVVASPPPYSTVVLLD